MTSTLKTHIHRKNNKGAACSLAFMEFSLCPLSSHSHVYTYRNLCQQTQVINPADKMWNFKGGGDGVGLCLAFTIVIKVGNT